MLASFTQQGSPPFMEGPYPGGRRLITEALRAGGVPEASLPICLSSITESTLKQYDVGLKLWWKFCKEERIDVFEVTVISLLRFLTYHFERGSAYSTLNSYRSAVAQIAPNNIAEDFRLKRFFREAYSLRPSLAKYKTTWDPGLVLDYVKSLPEDLTLAMLTYKVAVLLTLATGQRVQTIASIELENILENEELTINNNKRIKIYAKNRLKPTLVLHFFKEDSRVCDAQSYNETRNRIITLPRRQ